MRILFIGMVKSSYCALQHLLRERANVVGVITAGANGFNTDWADLKPLCDAENVPCHLYHEDGDVELLAKEYKPDVIICIGWSKLLPQSVLDAAKVASIGFHPAALPMNRGRHPLIWALALGLSETASTLFVMRAGADSGPILSQVKIQIAPSETASTLYAKIIHVLPQQLNEALAKLSNETLLIEQDESVSNTWRKRTRNDGRIDFRMHAKTIDNLVRALTRPYPGATVFWRGVDYSIWTSEIASCEEVNFEPGKVLSVCGRSVLVKTADSAIWLHDHEIEPIPSVGDYF